MKDSTKTSIVLNVLVGAFLVLTVAFLMNMWKNPVARQDIPLVDPEFTSTATVRTSYAELASAGEDLSDFDCYGCHEKGKPPTLRFDEKHNLIIPEEHSNIVMGHGRNNRNDICTNCHDEANLELFQTRDGRELKFSESTELCGSCHGPTYRDWDAGAHGRTSGYWKRDMGAITRKDCVSCHNPHSPKFPGRRPAPAPHTLRPLGKPAPAAEGKHD
ncbi:hypothetical protein M0Q28_07115 [Patescibacteria group bacterium]|jgi:hypothetical protein|nr:hypothetical protein [Patescibacteria group bacterium]